MYVEVHIIISKVYVMSNLNRFDAILMDILAFNGFSELTKDAGRLLSASRDFIIVCWPLCVHAEFRDE